jgi:hypothetical protein
VSNQLTLFGEPAPPQRQVARPAKPKPARPTRDVDDERLSVEESIKQNRMRQAPELEAREARARAIEAQPDGWLLPPKAQRSEFVDVYGNRYWCRPATNVDRAALTRAGATSGERPIIYTREKHGWLIEGQRPANWPNPCERYISESGPSEAAVWRIIDNRNAFWIERLDQWRQWTLRSLEVPADLPEDELAALYLARVGCGSGGVYQPPYNVSHHLQARLDRTTGAPWASWGGHFNGLGSDWLAAGGPMQLGWHSPEPVNYEHRPDLGHPPFVPLDVQAYIRQHLRTLGYEVLDPLCFDEAGYLSVRLSGDGRAVCP